MPSVTQWAIDAMGYPAKKLQKSISDYRLGHKVARNQAMIVAGLTGLVLGAVIPLKVSSSYYDYIKNIFQAFISWGNVSSEITSVLGSMWGFCALLQYSTKKGTQFVCFMLYKDTNSDHILTNTELKKVVDLYEKAGINRDAIELNVKTVFDYLIKKIKAAKLGIPTSITDPHLDPLHADWTKSQYKQMLHEFRIGNIDPYESFIKMEDIKRRVAVEKLVARADAIYAAFQPVMDWAEQLSPKTSQSKPNTPRHRAVAIQVHQRARTRASLSVAQLEALPNRAQRTLTQWMNGRNITTTSQEAVKEVEKLMSFLAQQRELLNNHFQEIPRPSVINLQGRPQSPPASL